MGFYSPVYFGHIELDQEVEHLATWQPFNVLLNLVVSLQRNVSVPVRVVVITQTHLYMRTGQK